MRNLDHHRITGHVAIGTVSPVSFCLLLLVLLISGCGGGGGGGGDSDTTEKIEISGAILIPGGAVSADNTIGLKGAANRPVSLYRIDDTGTIIGDVLDTTTSDQNGNYVLLLPADIEYASDIIVEAAIGPTANDKARAIVLDATTNVTPITEYITQKLIDDPTLDMSALPLGEVAKLIAFVESLPLPPQPDLSSMLAGINNVANIAVEAQIDDINDGNQQVRLSGLLSAPGNPGNPGAPRPAPGAAAKDLPVPTTRVELWEIDDDGINKGTDPIAFTDTNSYGVYSLEVQDDLNFGVLRYRLQAIYGGDTYWAMVIGPTVNVNSVSTYVAIVFQQKLVEPDIVPSSLATAELSGIVQFVVNADCQEFTDFTSQQNELANCAPEVVQQIDNAVNHIPVITQGDSIGVTMDEDGTPVAFVAPSITATDTDSGTLTWSGSTATSGTATVSGVGISPTISYVPAADFNGVASFDVTVDDGSGGSDTITVNVTIDPQNDAPVIDQGASIGVTMDEDGSPTAFVAPTINATDIDGGALTWTGTAATSGTATVTGSGANPTITYAPLPGFSGNASFDAIVDDGLGGSATITINVTVGPINDAPIIAEGDSIGVTMDEDGTPVAFVAPSITATDTDSGTLTWSGSTATSGTATVSGVGISPTISYVPAADFNGVASFDVTVDDGSGGSDTITVNVTIDPQNDAPVIGQGASIGVTMDEDGSPTAFVAPTINATDIDGGALTWTGTAATSGTATVTGSGANPTITYAPLPGFSGNASFDAIVDDGLGGSATITINVTVGPINDAPIIAEGDSIGVTMDEDGTPVAFVAPSITATDTDSGTLTWSGSTATSGTATVSGVGISPTISYVPAADFNGVASFDVTVDDGSGGSDTITVNVTIDPQNDAPVIGQGASIGVTMDEDGSPTAFVAPTINATDIDGGALTWTGTAATSGTATVSGSGANPTITYAPLPGFSGNASFDAIVDDGLGGSATITINVTVGPVNDAPIIAEGDSIGVTMDEDGTPVAFVAPSITATDTDSGTLTWSGSTATSGTATVSGVGISPTISYVPAADFNGVASFDVTVDDGSGGSDTITVNVTIDPQNDAPVIDQGASIGVTMDEDGNPTAFVAPTISATDIDGGALTWTGTAATSGTATVTGSGANPTITYAPLPGFSGNASFDAIVDDGLGGSATITINVTVGPINDAPIIAEGDSIGVTMDEDGTPVAFVAPSITATDTDSGTLTWSGSTATSGTATVSGVGISPTISYVPAADFNGVASFDVTVDDGSGGSDTITVNVTIDPQNDAPVIDQGASIGVTMDEDGSPTAFVAPTINATDIDGGALTWTGTAATSGTATVTGSGANPTITYAPLPGFSGNASFDAIVDDGLGGSATITINVTVGPINDAPIIAEGDSIGVTMDEDGTPVAFVAPSITATDTDSGTLTWSGSTATSGTATVSGVGISPTISYVPAADFNGVASFDVTVDDGSGGSDTITVNVTIDPQNDAPVIDQGASIGVTMDEDGNPTAFVAPTISATDIDGGALTWTGTAATSGTATVTGSGANPTITYAPLPDFSGNASFDAIVDDGLGGSATITINVTVGPVNDAPIATDDTESTTVDVAVTTADVLLNDDDVDGDILSVVAGNPAAANGTVVNNNDGTFTYTPNAGFTGFDVFTYTVTDSQLSDTATVTITINPAGVLASVSQLLDPALGGGLGGWESYTEDDNPGEVTQFVIFKATYDAAISNLIIFDDKIFNYATQTFIPFTDVDENDDLFLKDGGGAISESQAILSVETVDHGDGSMTITTIDPGDNEVLERIRLRVQTRDISGELIANHLVDEWASAMLDPGAIFGLGALQVSLWEETAIDSYGIEMDDWCESVDPARFVALNGNCNGFVLDGASNTYATSLDQLISATAWVDPDDGSETGLVAAELNTNWPNQLRAELVSTGNTVNYYAVDFTASGADRVSLLLSDPGGWVRDTTVKNTDMVRFTVPESLWAQFPTEYAADRRGFYVVQNGAVRYVDSALAGENDNEQEPEYNGIAIDQVLANFDPSALPNLTRLVGTWVADTPSSNGDPTVIHVFDNGYYEISGTCEPDGTTGMEYGTVDWNNVTGAFSTTASVSTRGLCSAELAGANGDTLVVNGDVLTQTVAGIGDFTFSRMRKTGNPLVGSWVAGDIRSSGEGHTILTILDDTTFTLSQNCSSFGVAGFEYGTYVWDQGTDALSGTLSIDTNSSCGVHDNTGLIFSGYSLTVSGDTLTVNDGSTDSVFVRHSSTTLPCDYESGWDDVQGEPLVFNSYTDFEGVVADCGGAVPTATADLSGTTWVDTWLDGGVTFVETVDFNADGSLDIAETADGVPSGSTSANWVVSNNRVTISAPGGSFLDIWAFTPAGIKVYTEETSWSSAPDLATLDDALEGEIWTGNYVNGTNISPIAHPDSTITIEDTSKTTLNVLFNDTDFDDGSGVLFVTDADTVSMGGGTVVDNGNGTFDYTPASNFQGTDSFNYTVSDGTDSSSATVTVVVIATNDPPVIAQTGPLTVIMDEDDTPLAFVAPTITATDADSATLTWSGSLATEADVMVSGTGPSPSITYIVDPDANGSDDFRVTVSDGDGGSASITINVTINAVNDLPTIDGTPPTTAAVGVPYSFRPNGGDFDGEALSFNIQNLPIWATLDTADGTLSGTPGAGDVGQPFTDITISITAGSDTVELTPFDITVNSAIVGGAVWDQFDWGDGRTWQ